LLGEGAGEEVGHEACAVADKKVPALAVACFDNAATGATVKPDGQADPLYIFAGIFIAMFGKSVPLGSSQQDVMLPEEPPAEQHQLLSEQRKTELGAELVKEEGHCVKHFDVVQVLSVQAPVLIDWS
jgi:hypothetical protein